MSGRKKASRKEKARKRSGGNEAGKKGSTGGTAVGAKPGRMKGNEQEAEYENLERKHGKPGGGESGKPRKRERRGRTGEATVRRKREERGKEETEAE